MFANWIPLELTLNFFSSGGRDCFDGSTDQLGVALWLLSTGHCLITSFDLSKFFFFGEKVRFYLRIASHAYTKDVSETLSLETFVEFSTGPSDTGNDYEWLTKTTRWSLIRRIRACQIRKTFRKKTTADQVSPYTMRWRRQKKGTIGLLVLNCAK